MYDRETVGLAPCAPGEGMTRRETAELCGVPRASVDFWAAGRVPHERGAGRIRVGGRTGARDTGGAGGECEGEGRLRGGDDREHAAQGGVGQPKSGRLRPGHGLEAGERLRAETACP